MQMLDFSSLPSLKNSNLPERTQELLIRACQSQITERNSFSVGDHTGSLYHISQLSTAQELTRHCTGRVGESACIKQALYAAVDGCVASRLAEAELKNAL